MLDEFARECLAIRIERKPNSTAVIDVLTDLFVLRACRAISVPTMAGVHRQGGAELDHGSQGQDGLDRALLVVGEGLLRELQLQAPG
ncbi:putative transposase [Azorhizobium caulinodans ORS 571]|uniref:Putative transposase n=1 Tax=Azorhizobium caulinodans (strain ATCC 43989 / DSM 5975 / JCM 20966 / LMG 6465 / NBRC 14845 / NCIMB 13405 / ORS 571) TaxID=438753 RepID=A8IP93_AZOC5|nr:hypothetical protein [Azorhizobium caulinodans]BAF89844.1 putative transposase [Azorhizobium caulinodans ORS 571]